MRISLLRLAAALVLLALAAFAAPRRCGAAPPPAPGAPVAARIGREIDAWSKPLVAAGELSGSLLVAYRDRIVLERSWSMANIELRVPNTPETRFCVASITKPMTVILALRLMREGRLGYQDSLAKWIPGFPSGDRITIEHLLRHRSGIPHRVTTEEQESQPHTAADMVELAKRAKLEFAPGERYSYSSGGYAVLARVLELASGRDYGTLLRERLFEPLGMKHSSHAGAREILPGRAASYLPEATQVRNAPLQDLSFLVGAGSVVMTARDLHTLLWADASGSLGEEERQSAFRGPRIFWNGHSNGFRAFAEYDSASQCSIIWTGNFHTGAADQLRAAAWKILGGERAEPAKLPVKTPAAVKDESLRRYEGLYDIANNSRLPVRATPYGLDVNGWALVATSDSTFFSQRDYGEVTAVRGPDGRSIRLDWMVAGQSFPCPRVGELTGR